MKKSFMTRVLAVSLSAAMAFSVSSASNLMTASAASTVNLKTTFKTLKVNQKYKMTLKNNTLNWKITKVQTSNKKICTVYGKTSSYVMLKGKGVGRAKITVTVKTTKRKKNNVKKMKCTANVKAAAPEETFSASAVANSNTEVKVNFTQAVDAAAAENFTVSDGVTVSEAKLSDDKKSVVLTVAGAEYGKNYDLTVTGIKVAGKAQADQKLTFTTPAATDKYPMTLEAKDPILKSDSSSQTLVTFTIKDENGNLIKDKGVEVAFATSLGKFAEQRVSIQDGVATNMYTAETLMETQTAQITATVVESTENKELLGLNTTASITLTPNPDELTTAVGAIITSATAPTADRVIAYFNQKVEAKDFLTKSKKLDNTKFTCEVRSGLDNGAEISGTTQEHKVVGVLDVPGEDNALQLLVDKPMMDNSNIRVHFVNKTNTNTLVTAENTVFCKLTDARQPSALNVTSNGLREIKVEFSEAMLATKDCTGFAGGDKVLNEEAFFAADNVDNYLIDGQPITNWGVVRVDPGEENPDSTDGSLKLISEKKDAPSYKGDSKGSLKVGRYDSGEDKRHIVTITLGTDTYLTPGRHRLSISNVGDWAAKTDKERNIVNTQGFDFDVEQNDVVPTFTVEPQSPEQYKLKFNCDFKPVNSGETLTTPHTVDDVASILQLQQREGSSWVTISDSEGSGKNPIRVSKISNEDNAYIVEVTKDWTEVYKTSSTRVNYHNQDLRLYIAPDKIVNVANNKKNTAIEVPLTGDIMKAPDVVSPVIGEVVQAEDKNGNLLESWNVTLSEPVKLSETANREGLTPSEKQKANAKDDVRLGVPTPSARFISEDGTQTIDGIITENVFVDATDTTINVEPSQTLSAGTWRLAISSISDDVENTAATVVHDVTVTRETAATNFRIVWAAVSTTREFNPDNIGNGRKGRYIFVKFNKPVMLTGNSTNAQVTGNYTINGSTLPTGTQIYAKINGYDGYDVLPGTATDSITIALPEGQFNGENFYTVDSLNAMLNVSRAITSTSGETLSNGGMIRLPFQYGESATSAVAGNGISEITSLTTKTDAVWGNDAEEICVGATVNGIKGEVPENDYYQKLKAALESDKYRKVILTHSLNLEGDDDVKKVFGNSRTLTIKRAVDFDLKDYNILGNVVVNTSDIVKSMTIKADTGSITGYSGNREGTATLTVNAGTIAHFEISGVTINKNGDGNAVNINDTFVNTFENVGTINGDVCVTDANGAGINNVGTVNGKLVVNTKAKVKLDGTLGKITDNIEVKDTAIVDVQPNANITGTKITVTAANARIILDETTKVDSTTVIRAEAKDVRVTIPQTAINNNIKLEKGVDATFKSVTADNKDVTASKDDAVLIDNEKGVSYTASANVVAKLDVYTGVVGTKEVGDITITRGAISGGGLDVKKLKDKIEAEKHETEAAKVELKVTYDLRTSYALVKSGDVIKFKDNIASGRDRIKVTISYTEKATNGDTVATGEVVKWINVDEK